MPTLVDPSNVKQRSLRRAAGLLGPLAWLALAAGCGGGDGDGSPIVGAPQPSDRPTAVCSGVPLSGDNVVFVSPQGLDVPGCGSKNAPSFFATCRSLAGGLASAGPAAATVIAMRHGLYSADYDHPIGLLDGVSIYGSCLFDGEPDRKYRTVIQPDVFGTRTITSEQALRKPITLSGLVVIGPDTFAGVSSGGGTSITMALGDSTGLTLSNMVLIGGKGGDGSPPAPPNVNEAGDSCFKPGGVQSEAIWGPPNANSLSWIAGAGGAGSGETLGLGGVGGQQGGASIALLLLNSTVAMAPGSVRIIAGPGGNGGAGQGGGKFSIGKGAGSGGAGGNGGPSIAIALRGSATVAPSGAYLNSSLPSSAGTGGAAGFWPGFCSGDPGAAGYAGARARVVNLDQGASILGPGQSISGGKRLFSPNRLYNLVMESGVGLFLWEIQYVASYPPSGNNAASQALMQPDGNFCLLPGLPWCSGGPLRPGSYLILRDDGALQVTDGVNVTWSSQ